jgi:hypothetical protein
MPFQKRLLAAVRKRAVECSSTGHAAHAKYVHLLSLSPDIGEGFVLVHLRFLPPSIGLRNERLALCKVQFDLALPNIATYRGLRHPDLRKFFGKTQNPGERKTETGTGDDLYRCDPGNGQDGASKAAAHGTSDLDADLCGSALSTASRTIRR